MKRWGWLLLSALLWCLLWGGVAFPAWASPTTERQPLTVELLKQRLASPMKREGTQIIDLRRTMIDLRPENSDFRDAFYRQLQSKLQYSGSPVGLDLSEAVIQGEFAGNRLAMRLPLYGQASSPALTEEERSQLQRDRRRLSQLNQLSQSLLLSGERMGRSAPSAIGVFRGPLKLNNARFTGPASFTNTFFLQRVDAQGADFSQSSDWTETRFSRRASFANARFSQTARFRNSIFFNKAGFNRSQFRSTANFQGSEFQDTAGFNQANFEHFANFARCDWQGTADFSQARWQEQAFFSKAQFRQSLFFTEASFEQPVNFYEAQFSQPINLRSATLLKSADFSSASFAPGAYLNLPGISFNPDRAVILGDPGEIGRVVSVPSLQGNESLLRNLVRNFRQLEQIADANRVEYLTEQLRLKALRQRLLNLNINTASQAQLKQLGFSASQATALIERRDQQSFRELTDLLSVPEIDLATYVAIRNRAIATDPISWQNRLSTASHWLGLSLLVWLSRYGTSFGLVFGEGILAIANFGLVFWIADRVRQAEPHPPLPGAGEVVATLGCFLALALYGLIATLQTAPAPHIALLVLATFTLVGPGILLLLLYRQETTRPGIDCSDIDSHEIEGSYFVEDGSMRQLRLLIGRLPVIPRYYFFRDRYFPLLWGRRWNWLNYYDFSLNNLLKLGFNDVRLRDRNLPGLLSSLAWYQWSLGLLYIALLLWTLSRTIPGLNLLIYLK